jgi:hypothetical protein
VRFRLAFGAPLRKLCLLALLAQCGAALAADLTPLLDRIAAAYGNTVAPMSILQTGRTYSNMRGEGALLRAYRKPDRFRVEIAYAGGEEVRILNGPGAWQQGQAMSEMFRDALLLQVARMNLPWNLFAAKSVLRDLGVHPLNDGTQAHIFVMPMAGGQGMEVAADPTSGRILRSNGVVTSPEGGEMAFGTIYENFKTADGRLYAATERHFAMGRYIGQSKIDTVQFDIPLANTLFRPTLPGAI